jgi:hypothetical protein
MVSWTEKPIERLKLLRRKGLPATVNAKKLGPEFIEGRRISLGLFGACRQLALKDASFNEFTRRREPLEGRPMQV